jgi:trk system potassium uptake protein TrkH
VKLLYKSESTGINLRSKVRDTTKGIWKSYFIITLFVIVYLIVGTYLILPHYPLTENIFDSICQGMSGLSSGGFSTLDGNIAGYNSAAMEYLYILPMILGAFSLPFYYRIIFKGKFSEIWKDVQTRSLLICFSLGSVILTLLLMYSNSSAHPLRDGVFQFVSAMSTNGWHIANIQLWDDRSLMFVIFGAMFIGGAWGGTVGGIKIYRAALIQKGIHWNIKKEFFSQKTVKTLKFDGKVMLPDETNEQLASASVFVILFFLIILGSAFITSFFIPANFSFIDSLFESTSAQTTSALSVGITNPSMNPLVEVIYIFQMWLGRLEIIPVLALFRSTVFGTNPKIL